MHSLPVKDLVSYETFEKLDTRVGTPISLQEVEKSDKLMKVSVDFGDQTRSILASIKHERENPQKIENRQTLFVVTLPENTMAGEIS
jgi:tRNA-binding protein